MKMIKPAIYIDEMYVLTGSILPNMAAQSIFVDFTHQRLSVLHGPNRMNNQPGIRHCILGKMVLGYNC